MFTNYGRFWGVRLKTDSGPRYRIGKEGADVQPFEQIRGDEVSHFISILTDLRLERESDVLYSPENRPGPDKFLQEFAKPILDERFEAEFAEVSGARNWVGADELAEIVGMNYGTLISWFNKYILPDRAEKPEKRTDGYCLRKKTAQEVKILRDLRFKHGVSMQAINQRDRNKIFHQILGVEQHRTVPVHE